MGLWTDYTKKDTPEDNDTLMLYDAAGKANKQTLFSGFWKWVAKKLKEATLSDLKTTNKTMIGAINELNSNMTSKTYDGKNYSSQFCRMYVSKNLGIGKPSSIIVFGYEGIGVAFFNTMYSASNPAPRRAINIYGEIFKIVDKTILVNFNTDRNRQIVIISPQGVEIELEPVE